MKARILYPVAKISLSRASLSSTFLRTFFSRSASYHNESWEIESDDESERLYKLSRGNYSKSRKFVRNGPQSYSNRPRFNYFERQGSGRFESFAGESLSTPKWDEIELQHFEKNLYTPSDEVLNRPQEEVEEFRKAHGISLLGRDVPNPIIRFSDYQFPREVSGIISQKGFETPTPIQAQGWPIALSGRDLIGIAKTGSGKTLGYILPCLAHINHQPEIRSHDGPIGLVIAPTRELVQQIHQVTREASTFTRTRTACLFGGASKNVQAQSLFHKPSLCIATPGRLLDFLEGGVTNLKRCTYLVMDEADRMLDMGFEPQIRRIVDQIRPDRQTLMWSATWPREVQDLAGDFLTDCIQLNVGSLELVANSDIEQVVEVCNPFEKHNRFIDRMKEELEDHRGKILVFSQTKSQVDFLVHKLYQLGIKARGIHGDYSQSSRDNTLNGFRNGRFPVLVATDVASRGLDVDDISLVVNYDFPNCIDDYIHRIGRTGRAGKAGKSLSFVTEHDAGLVKELIRVLKEAKQDVPPELAQLLEYRSKPMAFKKKYRSRYGRDTRRRNDFGWDK